MASTRINITVNFSCLGIIDFLRIRSGIVTNNRSVAEPIAACVYVIPPITSRSKHLSVHHILSASLRPVKSLHEKRAKKKKTVLNEVDMAMVV